MHCDKKQIPFQCRIFQSSTAVSSRAPIHLLQGLPSFLIEYKSFDVGFLSDVLITSFVTLHCYIASYHS